LPIEETDVRLATLAPTDQARFLSQALVRSKDGCAWIFENQKYILWHEDKDSSLLWITGKAGHGKTTLAAHICHRISMHHQHEVLAHQKDELKRVVLYFFFQKTNDEAVKTAAAACRTIIHQLVCQVPEALPILQKKHDSLSARGSFEWSWETLSAMLGEMLAQISHDSRVYIILDALDECELESRVLILDWAKELVDEHAASMTSQGLQTDLRILVASRSDGDIIDHLSDYPTIEITAADTENDIQALIHTRVEKFARQRHLGSDVTQPILQFLESNAHGMFLWVVLIMQELERRDERLTDEVIASKLSRIPLTLYDTYISIIHNTPAARRKDMWTIYQWLLFGSRNLTLTELETAMCLETCVSTWHDFAGDLNFLCGSLIRVGGPQEEVSFVHQTARGFLEAFVMNASAADVGAVEMDTNAANEHLATICVRYLLLKEELFAVLKQVQAIFESNEDNSDGNRWKVPVRDCLKRHKLLLYTVQSWAIHAQAVCAPSSTLAVIIRTFLSSAMHRNGIMNFKLFPDEKFHFSDFRDGAEPLHVAAYFKILWLAQMYISEDRTSVHAITLSRDTPLIFASEMGSTECVRILLEMGADPNHIGGGVLCWTALHLATLGSYVDVVTLLLEHDASLDIQDKDGWTALHHAAFKGNVNIMTILLKHGASLDIQDKDGWTALHVSASNGHVDVVTLLLEHGASLDIQDKDGWTALHVSASNGHVDIVTLLLEHGASLDVQSSFGMTPLDFAILFENWNVVDVLVQWAEKAGMNLQDLMKSSIYKMWRQHAEGASYSETVEDSSGHSQPSDRM
jgi:ankyrin repeat protein